MTEEEQEGHKSLREGDETRAKAILALSLQLGGFVGVHGGYDEKGLLENGQLLFMPKISGTTPDVIAWSDRSCTVTLRWADLLFIGVPCGLGCSGDPIGLDSECFRRVNMLQMHKYRTSNKLAPRVPMVWPALGAKAGVRTGPVAGSVSGARRRRAACAVCYAMVLLLTSAGGGAVHQRWWSFSIVPGEVLPRSTQRAPIVVRSWSMMESIGPTQWWSFNIVPGEGFSSCWGSSARVNTKGPDSGPLMVHDGEHRTNSMVVVQHSSRGSFALIRNTRLPALLQRS
ncbi:hypothetical protein TIFTF001_049865 [Ficus carica]|uniref:Uncharacterized protein n=1 Tax=Ficus carica TaxID=3494 RepID=A0AA87YQ20_FICCA|nr:hypothetical protein TIFTF001_049862 [Ficus carica]GMN18849.1 hypothetical protein TIFTF001_049863 [Ficus carica]GMN18854.1 hypothetical protein TIFTF001_049864 [Ficus carica]GMN18857.1 hypothetical protein TIFTF001_049865 [Ficus carica]